MSQITDQNQEAPELLSLKLDAVLKLYFARKENEEQLRQFLKATVQLSDDSLATIDIKNPILTKQHVQEKDFIVDIHLTSATGELIILEMQIQDHDGFIDRMVSYNARDFASQLRRGENYVKLKSAISLVIVDFEMFDDTDDYYEHILFRRKNRKIFTKAQQFFIIDLTKLPNELTKPLHFWGKLFKVETEEELRMLMEESEEMKEAGEKLLELSADKEAQEIVQARKDSQWAWNHMINATEERVREETEVRVREETEVRVREEERKKSDKEKAEILQQVADDKVEAAKRFLAMGLSIEDVAKGTGLDCNDICKFT